MILILDSTTILTGYHTQYPVGCCSIDANLLWLAALWFSHREINFFHPRHWSNKPIQYPKPPCRSLGSGPRGASKPLRGSRNGLSTVPPCGSKSREVSGHPRIFHSVSLSGSRYLEFCWNAGRLTNSILPMPESWTTVANIFIYGVFFCTFLLTALVYKWVRVCWQTGRDLQSPMS